MAWGDSDARGENSAVQVQLRNVRHVRATETALVAILGKGSVVTWGDSDAGGDSSVVQVQLRKVQHIQPRGARLPLCLAMDLL